MKLAAEFENELSSTATKVAHDILSFAATKVADEEINEYYLQQIYKDMDPTQAAVLNVAEDITGHFYNLIFDIIDKELKNNNNLLINQ